MHVFFHLKHTLVNSSAEIKHRHILLAKVSFLEHQMASEEKKDRGRFRMKDTRALQFEIRDDPAAVGSISKLNPQYRRLAHRVSSPNKYPNAKLPVKFAVFLNYGSFCCLL